MLTELETLSQNIGRLIEISQRYNEARLALEEQLAQARAECEATRVELEQTREERNALQAERDALSAKIDDAKSVSTRSSRNCRALAVTRPTTSSISLRPNS